MNFLQNPELLPTLIEGIEKVFNAVTDIFAEDTTDDSFEHLHKICEQSHLLSVYDYFPAMRTTRKVQRYYDLLTEIVLRGAKRIWVNPRNKLKKRIAGLYLISILYANQPMPGFPAKIRLDAKDLFCVIGTQRDILFKAIKRRIQRMRFVWNESMNILRRLGNSNAFEITVESEYFNILPDRRIIIETYEKLNAAERQSRTTTTTQQPNLSTALNLNDEGNKALSTNSISTNIIENSETSTENRIVPYNPKSINSTVVQCNGLKFEVKPAETTYCIEESWAFSKEANDDYDLHSGDDDSEYEENDDSDGYDLLISGDVPQLDERDSFCKTAASMEAGEEALKFLMRKNSFKPSRSKNISQEERGKANVNLILKTIKVAKERCYGVEGENQMRRKENDFAFPPEFMKLKQAADESVKMKYGLIRPETRVTEKMWLSKEARDGSKALSIFNMHQKGTLEEKEGIRLVTKYFNNKEAHVLVERVSTDMEDENLFLDETEKKCRRMNFESKDCLTEAKHWDSFFYQPKYLNNYHRQLQNTVEEFDKEQKDVIDVWADKFVKRFRLDREFTQTKPSFPQTDENQDENWVLNNIYSVQRIQDVNPSGLELAIYNKYCRKQGYVPLKILNTNDVEMSEEPVEEKEKQSTDLQNSICKSIMVSPRKGLTFSMQTKCDVEMLEYREDEECSGSEMRGEASSSSPKILSMPNLDSFFGLN